MSESDAEHAARSVALEQAYVHEVYEQCAEKATQSKHWPRIYQFLQELEPGALVCDIGCGNGKYLSVNHSIFKVGVDRCKRFTDIAREKENEVLICDNLALPFREESFDAVLSIAVVHHFATTERRVHALKELARVLRIGGRLVISVWAMEQKHRKFESQDVLVPWPKSYCMSAVSDGTKRSGASNGNEKHNDDAAQKYPSSSKRCHKKNSQQKYKSKSYWIDPIFSLSPSTSSLSSPNETCYSCFRRALQKLARSRRIGSGRAWFPGGWQSSSKNRRHYDSEDATDVDELPIELRRVETSHTLITNKPTDTLSIKSKSLGDILEIERLDLVRSRSSIPGFCSTSELILDERSVSSSSSGSKPRLVKQKSYVEETDLENPEDTAIGNLIKDLPDFACQQLHNKRNVLKQSSMNEELMSTERLEEKERVRRNIMKQTSLNEELICKWRTFEAFKDTISPVNASRRFQLLKSGLTSKIKRSTTNIEKVSSMSIKNGFVRMLQGWKSSENETSTAEATTKAQPSDKMQPQVTAVKRNIESVERRLSREDGSDSSKDSSLQSDTSVDSEDSFASVIFVPKQETPAVSSVNEVVSSARPAALQLVGTTSAPPSPRVKQPPDGQNSRFKLIGMSTLLKQQQPQQQPQSSVANSATRLGDAIKHVASSIVCQDKVSTNGLQTSTTSQGFRLITEPCESNDSDTAPLIRVFNDVTKAVGRELIGEDETRKARLNQVKELLSQKPGFATRSKSSFPLIRRGSVAASGRLETVTRILPRLSLELFNPETDDLDSDSSGVSSPESVGSVISVTLDEKYVARKEAETNRSNVRVDTEEISKSNENSTKLVEVGNLLEDKSNVEIAATFPDSETFLDCSHDCSSAASLDGEAIREYVPSKSWRFSDCAEEDAASSAKKKMTCDDPRNILENDTICPASSVFLESARSISSQSMRLLEAAANVANSLEDAVGTVIQRTTQTELQLQSQVAKRRADNGDFWSNARTRAHLRQDRKSASMDTYSYSGESSNDLVRNIDRYCQNSSLDFRNVYRRSRVSSSLDIADNNLNAESAVATTHWEECNGLPKKTLWIVNEAYDKSELADSTAVQSESILKQIGTEFPLYKSQAIFETTDFDLQFKRESNIESKYGDQLGEVKLETEFETKHGSEYGEMFKSEDKSNDQFVANGLNSESNISLIIENERANIDSEGERKLNDFQVPPESNFRPGVEVKSSQLNGEGPSVGRGSSNISSLPSSNSDDTLDFVMVSKTGEFECEDASEDSIAGNGEKWRSQGELSIDSSDVGDSIENTTTSLSDGSQAESTAKLFTGSTMSLVSNMENTSRSTVERRRLQERGRSLDEISSDAKKKQAATDCLVTATDTLSKASSQESLPSDRGGGAITYHQYYHVFREGELDQLINKYVENLHIISSYYDHSSWCVVAEKVQVWTI